MSSILAATLGNTTAAIAPVTDGIVGDALRVPISRLADLREGFAAGRWDPVEEGIPVIVASVNPPALEAFARLSAEAAGVRPEAAGVDFPIPIETDVDEPEKVGVDRLLAALAAYRQVKGACIVVDAGTAVTIDAVSADGVFQGGAIFPGLDLMALRWPMGRLGCRRFPCRPKPLPWARTRGQPSRQACFGARPARWRHSLKACGRRSVPVARCF